MKKKIHRHTQTERHTYIICRLTCLAELWGAAALAGHAHHGGHLCPDARAPLLEVSTHQAHGRVRLAAVGLLQAAHVPANAGALCQIGAIRHTHLPVFHFGRKVAGQWTAGGIGKAGKNGMERKVEREGKGKKKMSKGISKGNQD